MKDIIIPFLFACVVLGLILIYALLGWPHLIFILTLLACFFCAWGLVYGGNR